MDAGSNFWWWWLQPPDCDRFVGLQHETKSEPARAYIQFSACVRDLQQLFFLNPDQNNESIHTNYSLVTSQVSAPVLPYDDVKIKKINLYSCWLIHVPSKKNKNKNKKN